MMNGAGWRRVGGLVLIGQLAIAAAVRLHCPMDPALCDSQRGSASPDGSHCQRQASVGITAPPAPCCHSEARAADPALVERSPQVGLPAWTTVVAGEPAYLHPIAPPPRALAASTHSPPLLVLRI
jgi:hypothetical protein